MKKNQMIVLNEDEKAVILKALQDINLSVNQLYHLIKNDSLTETMKETIPQLIEFHMADVSKKIGFDSLSSEKIEQRYKEIREAHKKIQELEKKLGNTNPIDGLKEQLSLLARTFRRWWKSDGFGYVAESNFTEYGHFEATLGFSFHRSSVFSKTPISDKKTQTEWLNELKEAGYRIYESDNNGDRMLIDCPENRILLSELLKNRFPSSIIERFESQIILDSESWFELHLMKIVISELSDLEQLKKEMENQSEEA